MLSDSNGRSCVTCAEPAHDATSTCPFCGAERDGTTEHVPFRRSLRDAATSWSRSVAGAPRRFAELICAVQVRDEVVQRIATEVLRRELRLHVEPAIHRAFTGRNLEPAAIDPFAMSADRLRLRSEHLRVCSVCRGTGACACMACGARGIVDCMRCVGAGETGNGRQRMPCAQCAGDGVVGCETCQGATSLNCTKCAADGYERAWWTYDESSRWIVDTVCTSPAVEAYPQLAAPRFLTAADLPAFELLGGHEVVAPDRVEPVDEAGESALVDALSTVDPYCERVVRQQYLCLSMVRRDITYRMCASSGSVAFCGHDLVAVPAPNARRPMRVRNALWVVVGLGFAALLRYGSVGLHGKSAYFSEMNARLNGLWLLASLLAVPVIGGMLRALGSRTAGRKLRLPEVVLTCAVLMVCVAMFGVRSAAQPYTSQVQVALNAGRVGRARAIVDALKETLGGHVAVRRAEDDVLLMEAVELPLAARLRVLDEVVAHAGPQARFAAASARSYRLQEIQRLMSAGLPSHAIGAIELWFNGVSRDDPEIAELRAAAHDSEVSTCVDEACRFIAARNANLARTCPDRAQSLATEREHLVSALSSKIASEDDASTQLERLQRLLSLASKTYAQLSDDSELGELAKRALVYAYAERAKLGVATREPIQQAFSARSRVIMTEGARHP